MPITRSTEIPVLVMLLSVSNVAASSKDQLTNGLRIAEQYHVSSIEKRRFTHQELWKALEPYLDSEELRVENVAESIEGRAIRAITFGQGSTGVLLWSQMHGDESTATMALMDMVRFFVEADGDALRDRIKDSLTVTMVPMLNPDGAEVFQRQNAIGVDVNRDARRLATPEARALKALRDRLEPDFGFNLHDQGPRNLAGEGGKQVAISILPPAFEEERTYNEVRSRARLIAAGIAEVLNHEIKGHLAKYDDEYSPRAFGDLMQFWGTSTVLIESGALADDPEKQRLRALNVAAILSALDAMATESYRDTDPSIYEDLPFNEGVRHDVILRGGRLIHGDGSSFIADVGLYYEDWLNQEELRLREIGDLEEAGALSELDVSGLFVHVMSAEETDGQSGDGIRLGQQVVVTVRRGVEKGAELVYSFGGDTP